MFYFDCTFQTALLLFLATKWKQIMSFWHSMEKPFLSAPYKISGISLSLKIKLISFMFTVFYFSEHFLFIGMEVHSNMNQLKVRFRVSLNPSTELSRLQSPNFRCAMFQKFHHWTITWGESARICSTFSPTAGIFSLFSNGPSRSWRFVGTMSIS